MTPKAQQMSEDSPEVVFEISYNPSDGNFYIWHPFSHEFLSQEEVKHNPGGYLLITEEQFRLMAYKVGMPPQLIDEYTSED